MFSRKILRDKNFSDLMRSSHGFSLIGVVVASGVVGILTLVMLKLFSFQLKSTGGVGFSNKREQLRNTLISQFLDDPNNCKCLFNGANQFPSVGTSKLTGVSPSEIGAFKFGSVPTCSPPPPIPTPLAKKAGIDSVSLASVELQNIVRVGSKYQGEFFVKLDSMIPVAGPSSLAINIPVHIDVAPGSSPSLVQFNGCSLAPLPAQNVSRNRCRIVLSPQVFSDDYQVHRVACPPNTAAVKFSVVASDRLDGSMALTCCEFGDLTVSSTVNTVGTGLSVGADNQEHWASCGNDQFITEIEVRATERLDGDLRISCRRFDGVALSKNTFGRASKFGITSDFHDDSAHLAECSESILSGIGFWAADQFDNITRIECSELN